MPNPIDAGRTPEPPVEHSNPALARAEAQAATAAHFDAMFAHARTESNPDARSLASREALLAALELMKFNAKDRAALDAFSQERSKADPSFALDAYLEGRMGDAVAGFVESRPRDDARAVRAQLERRITDVLAKERLLTAVENSIALGLVSDAILENHVRDVAALLRAADPALDARLIARERELTPVSGAKKTLNDILVEQMMQSMRVRAEGISKGQATIAEFRAGVERQVRNLAEEYAAAGSKPAGSQRRPTNYGRPPMQAAA